MYFTSSSYSDLKHGTLSANNNLEGMPDDGKYNDARLDGLDLRFLFSFSPKILIQSRMFSTSNSIFANNSYSQSHVLIFSPKTCISGKRLSKQKRDIQKKKGGRGEDYPKIRERKEIFKKRRAKKKKKKKKGEN